MDRFEHRKGTFKIHLVNADGTSAAGIATELNQTSHEFLFGCGAFDTLDMLSEQDAAKREFLTDRVEKWLKLFNYATLPFYWGRYEPNEGFPKEDITKKAAKWLKERDVTIKGHPLCWHTVCAPWLLKYSNQEILAKQLSRIKREVRAYKNLIDMWDVINEVVIMPVFDKYDNAVTRICKELGQVKLVKSVFDEARAESGKSILLINDFNTTKAYEELLERLFDAGVCIDVIGIQSHQHQGYWGIEKIHDVLERFSRFKLPLHFTENTLVSGFLVPPEIEDLNDFKVDEWPSTPEAEDRQARQMTEMYTELFAHPSVEAITNWSFTDGGWLGAPAGVLRADNGIKPSYEALNSLINDKWHTSISTVSDKDGFVSFKGFKGDYVLNVNGSTKALKLKDGITEEVII